jgi:filamentous hemagglutinin
MGIMRFLLNTKELVYNNIKDFYKIGSKDFGLSIGGGTTSDSGKNTLAPIGSITLPVKSTGEDREQITRATIGNGIVITGVRNYIKEYETVIDENGNLLNPNMLAET